MVGAKNKTAKAVATVEMLDVVDKDDTVLRQATRTEVEDEFLRFRIVHVMVTNDVGNLLVQWRKADKKVSPPHVYGQCRGRGGSR